MDLLALIIVFLAIITALAIAYVAWELSSGNPIFTKSPPPPEKDRNDSTDP